MVEFAFVGVLLVFLVLGIVVFGYMLSFQQDMTRAAAEGARVGAVAAPGTGQSGDARYDAAWDATDDAVSSFSDCGPDSGIQNQQSFMTCFVTITPCQADPTQDCLTVRLEYDYDGKPLIIDPPLLSALMPDKLNAESVVRLNQ